MAIPARGGGEVGFKPTEPAFSLLEISTPVFIWGKMIFIRRGKVRSFQLFLINKVLQQP